jgi:predicted ATPase
VQDSATSPDAFPQQLPYDHNLPVQPTSFIGRDQEVEAVRRMLLRHDARLLTITGPGGAGKTRLAIRAAESVLGHFRDGVRFVDLAPLADHRLVASAIARALGLREAPDQPLEEHLTNHLQGKHMLLVLDNFEHVLEAAPLVAELLSVAAELTVLITSRAVLHLRAEHDYEVPPMALPDRVGELSPERLGECESVRLFAERARAARADFCLEGEDTRVVAQICRYLDGLPLAIELAAARVRILDPDDLLARLGGGLRLLSDGPTDAPDRQRTLGATIDWSYRLLGEGERSLLCRLSVFAGGFTLEAAETVCGSHGSLDVLAGVDALHASSLLRRLEGTGRFGMLETVREYALERLKESGEAGWLVQRHAVYFLQLAERAEPLLRGPAQLGWLDRLETEHDNLRAALSYSLERGEVEAASRLVAALWRFWFLRGHWAEWDRWADAALSQLPAGGSPAFRANVTIGRAIRAAYEDEWGRAIVLAEECIALYRSVGDLGGLTTALAVAGQSDFVQGRGEQSRSRLAEAMLLAERVEDPWLRAWTQQIVGLVLCEGADYRGATPILEESLALSRATCDRWLIAAALWAIGWATRASYELDSAQRHLAECLMLSAQLDDRFGTAYALVELERVAFLRGEYARARELTERRLALAEQLGNRMGVVGSLHQLGTIAFEEGDTVPAREFLGRCLVMARQAGKPGWVVASLAGLGVVELAEGNHGRAKELLEEGLTVLEEAGCSPHPGHLRTLGRVAHCKGEHARAEGLFLSSLAGERDGGDEVGIIECVELLAISADVQGNIERAVRLLGAARAHRDALGVPSRPSDGPSVDRVLRRARRQLGEDALKSILRDGSAMDLERVVRYALNPGEDT